MIVSDAETTGKSKFRIESSFPLQMGAISDPPKSRSRQVVFFSLITFILIFFRSYGLAEDGKISGKNVVEIEYGYPDQSIFVATINDKGQPDTPMTYLAEALMTRALKREA